MAQGIVYYCDTELSLEQFIVANRLKALSNIRKAFKTNRGYKHTDYTFLCRNSNWGVVFEGNTTTANIRANQERMRRLNPCIQVVSKEMFYTKVYPSWK